MWVRFIHGGSNDHMYISLLQSSRRESSGETRNDTATTDGSWNGRPEGQGTGSFNKTGVDPTSGGCTLLVLARDGVYLSAPRRQERLLLSPGSRADVALSCDRPGVFRLASLKGDAGVDELPMTYLGGKTNVFEGKGFD